MVTEEICDSTFTNTYPNSEDEVGVLEAVWWHFHADEVTGEDVIGIARKTNDEFAQVKNSIARKYQWKDCQKGQQCVSWTWHI